MIYLQRKPYQIKIGCLTGCHKMHFMNCKSWKEGNIFTTTTLAECLTKRPAYFHVLPVPFIFQLYFIYHMTPEAQLDTN